MSSHIYSLLRFAGAWAVPVITPGTDTALTLRVSLTSGKRAGLGVVTGIALGLAVWGLGAALGLTSLLAASPKLFAAIKAAGAVYLAYLGLMLLARPGKALESAQQEAAAGASPAAGPKNFRGGFWAGLGASMLDPLIGGFDLSFFPQFVPVGLGVKTSAFFGVAFTAIQVMEMVLWYGPMVLIAACAAGLIDRHPVAMRWMDRLIGVAFLCFGYRLIMA